MPGISPVSGVRKFLVLCLPEAQKPVQGDLGAAVNTLVLGGVWPKGAQEEGGPAASWLLRRGGLGSVLCLLVAPATGSPEARMAMLGEHPENGAVCLGTERGEVTARGW